MVFHPFLGPLTDACLGCLHAILHGRLRAASIIMTGSNKGAQTSIAVCMQGSSRVFLACVAPLRDQVVSRVRWCLGDGTYGL